MKYLHQIPRVRDGLDHLLAHDPVFQHLAVKPQDLLWPYYGPGFPAFVRIVLGQQISTFAAAALWQRFTTAVPSITPNAILVLSDDDMRRLGLSYQKASYLRHLALAIREGRFDIDTLTEADADTVYEQVTALRGFGNWSAQMYMMFGLALPDIWPAGDLGIQEGLRRYHGWDERPDPVQTEAAGLPFTPHRTAAALLLWYLKQDAAVLKQG